MEAAVAWAAIPHRDLEARGMIPGDEGRDRELAAMTRGMRAGRDEDWARFAEDYFPRLFRYLLGWNRGDEAAAHDQLQETLLRVARTVHLDAGRRQGRYQAFLRRWFWSRSDDEREPEADPLPDLLARGLARLSEADRWLVGQKYFEDRTVSEIAAAAGCTEKAIESRLSRVRARLRDMLREDRGP